MDRSASPPTEAALMLGQWFRLAGPTIPQHGVEAFRGCLPWRGRAIQSSRLLAPLQRGLLFGRHGRSVLTKHHAVIFRCERIENPVETPDRASSVAGTSCFGRLSRLAARSQLATNIKKCRELDSRPMR
jgi:hypothetical protein